MDQVAYRLDTCWAESLVGKMGQAGQSLISDRLDCHTFCSV